MKAKELFEAAKIGWMAAWEHYEACYIVLVDEYDQALAALEPCQTIQYYSRQAGKTKAMLDKIVELKPCKIEIIEPKKCPRCGASYDEPCQTCGGSGQRPDFNAPTLKDRPFAFKQIPCPACPPKPDVTCDECKFHNLQCEWAKLERRPCSVFTPKEPKPDLAGEFFEKTREPEPSELVKTLRIIADNFPHGNKRWSKDNLRRAAACIAELEVENKALRMSELDSHKNAKEFFSEAANAKEALKAAQETICELGASLEQVRKTRDLFQEIMIKQAEQIKELQKGE